MQASFTQTRQGFAALRQQAKSRHRDIAAQLGLSEGGVLAAHLGGLFDASESPLRAIRLRAEWPDIVEALTPLGDVMALTRNESCVHEKIGTYRDASSMGPKRLMGLVLGGAIDLRLFYSQWAHGFAVSEQLTDGGLQQSLQFFDASGVAIHKIILRPVSDAAAYAALVERFRDVDQRPDVINGEPHAEPAEKPDAVIDAAGLRKDWAALRDTHDFFGLLKRYGVSRTQALRLADAQFVQSVPTASALELLQRAAQEGVPIMCFVGNPGMIQIHSGPVSKIAVMGPWLNVLDPGFNLHLREDHIVSAYAVRKPTTDGLVCSLELFDAQNTLIAQFFGERKPGQAERCDWRALLDSLVEGQPEAAAC